MCGLQLALSGALKDSPSYLSGPLSSSSFNRCRSRGTEGQAGPSLVLWGQAPTPQPPFTASGQPCPETGSKKGDGHLCSLLLPDRRVQVSLARATHHPFLSTCGESEPVLGALDGWAQPCPPGPPRTHTFRRGNCFF